MVFGPAEQLSYTLQSKDTNIQDAKRSAMVTEAFLRRHDSVVKESSGLTDDPVLPRKRKVPRRIDDGAEAHRFDTPRDYYRQLYFEVLDVLCNEISRRFQYSH